MCKMHEKSLCECMSSVHQRRILWTIKLHFHLKAVRRVQAEGSMNVNYFSDWANLRVIVAFYYGRGNCEIEWSKKRKIWCEY